MFLRPLAVACCLILIVGIGVLNSNKFDAATNNSTAETNFYCVDDFDNVNDANKFYSTNEESLSFSGNTSFKTLLPTYIPSGYKVNETNCTDEYIELLDKNGGYIICQTDVFSSDIEKLTVVCKKIDKITVTVIANNIDEKEAQKILNSIY